MARRYDRAQAKAPCVHELRSFITHRCASTAAFETARHFVKVLALHLPGMVKLARVPVAAYLAERNSLQASQIEEYHVCFKTFGNADEAVPVRHASYVRLHPSRSSNKPAAFLAMLRRSLSIVRHSGIDVVTTQDPMFLGFLGVLLKRLTGVRLNVQLHWPLYSNPYWRRIEGLRLRLRDPLVWTVLRKADTLYVNTLAEGKTLQLRGWAAQDIWVMPYTIDGEEFLSGMNNDNVRQRFSIEKDARLLLFVGRLAKQKNLASLLRALKIMGQRGARAKLLVVGTGPETTHAVGVVKDLALANQVSFAGEVPFLDLPAYYKAADLVVVPSWYEGTCRVLLEAAVCGKAVASTPTHGASEAIVDGETGFFIPRDDPERMADILISALSDPARLVAVGTAFQDWFRRTHSIDDFYRRWIDMLAFTASKRKRSHLSKYA